MDGYRDKENLVDNLEKILRELETLTALLREVENADDFLLDSYDFERFPRVVAEILLNVFRHCDRSETIYSSKITLLSKILMDVFKQTREVQTLHLTILSHKLKFDFSKSVHSDTLRTAVGHIISIGEVLINLDVKAMAEEWKGFIFLCEKYADSLQKEFIHERATKVLCDELKNNIFRLTKKQAPDAKEITRSLKVSLFILKILIKITEIFSGYIAENFLHFVHYIKLVYEYSIPNLIYLKISPAIIEGIRSHIHIGAELLLRKLILDPSFKQEFLKHGSIIIRDSNSDLGYLLSCIAIIKIILYEDEEIRSEWTDDIVSSILNIFDFYHTHLLRCYKFNSDVYENISLYDYVLLNTTSLIISTKDLSTIESILFQSILKQNIWSSMLACDIWIIVAKYGSPDFIYQQLQYLVPFFNGCANQGILNSTPQYCYLCHLITGLFKLLPDKYKIKIHNEYPTKEFYHLWNAIGLHNLPLHMMQTENDLIIQNSMILTKNIHDIPSNALINELELLTLINCETHLEKNVVLSVVEFWKLCLLNDEAKMNIKLDEKTVHGSQWFYGIVVLLCQVTENLLPCLDENSWIQILQIASIIIVKSASIVKFSILKLILNFVTYEIQNENSQLSIYAAWIFQILLKDQNALIYIVALTEFEYFIFNTVNENLVKQIILGCPEIKSVIKDLIMKKKFLRIDDEVLDKSSQKTVFKFTHKCERLAIDTSKKSDQILKPNKNFNSELIDIDFLSDCGDSEINSVNDSDNEVSNHLKIIKEELTKLISITNNFNEKQTKELTEIKFLLESIKK